MVYVSTSFDCVPFLDSYDQLIVYLCVPAGARLSKVPKGLSIMITDLFFHIFSKRTKLPLMQEVPRIYISLFLDTDEFKMVLRAEEFPRFSRNGPLDREIAVFCYLFNSV